MRLCDALGVDTETASSTYYACLLMCTGCTTDADVAVRTFHGNLTARGTHRQFGSAREAIAGVIGAIPSPESPWPRRAYEVTTRLPRAVTFARTCGGRRTRTCRFRYGSSTSDETPRTSG